MEQVGQMAEVVIARVSARSQSLGLTKPQAGSRPPTTVDEHCDILLPQKLFSGWIPDAGPREIIRPLTDAERGAIEFRADELREALTPLQPHQGAAADAAIAAMLGGFRAMRQQGDAVEATVRILRHILRDFPLWAIARGCLLVAQDAAGLDARWAPNDAELCSVVRGVVQFHKATLDRCEALLCAQVEGPPDPPRPSPAEIEQQIAALKLAVRPSHGDGNHMARVLADIAARKERASA